MSIPSDSTTSFTTSTVALGRKALTGVLESWPNPPFIFSPVSLVLSGIMAKSYTLWTSLSSLPPAQPSPNSCAQRLGLGLPRAGYSTSICLHPVLTVDAWQPSPTALFSYSMSSGSTQTLVAPVPPRHPWLCLLGTVLHCLLSDVHSSFPMSSDNCCLVPSCQSPEGGGSSNPTFVPLTEKHSPLSDMSSRCSLKLGPTTYWNYLPKMQVTKPSVTKPSEKSPGSPVQNRNLAFPPFSQSI